MRSADIEIIPVLDFATVSSSGLGRLPLARQRAAWHDVARKAATATEAFAPGSHARTTMQAVDNAARYMWSEAPAHGDPWDQPVMQVRRSLVQTLADRAGAAKGLSAALERVAELPRVAGPLGRDAATLVISAQILGMNEELLAASPRVRRTLARLLADRAHDADPDISDLAEFISDRLRKGAGPPIEAGNLPRLLRVEEIRPRPPQAGRQGVAGYPADDRPAVWRLLESLGRTEDVGEQLRTFDIEPALHGREPAGWAAKHAVLPLLTSYAYGDVSGTPSPGGPTPTITGGGTLNYGGVSGMPSPGGAGPGRPEAVRPDQLNVGVVRADLPGRPVTGGSVAPATNYLAWVSIGPQDEEALPDDQQPLDLDDVPAGDVLDVMIFADPALTAPGAISAGKFVMGEERPLRVLQGAESPDVAPADLTTRLYFALRTPAEEGTYHVSFLVYHRNVLLQVRRLILPVGSPGARLFVHTPYAIVSSPTAPSVREMADRRLSLYVSETDGGHYLCFRSMDGAQSWGRSAALGEADVSALVRPIRGGLRAVSWRSEEQWDGKRSYQYSKQASGRFTPDFDRFRRDVLDLARRGFGVWETLTSRFADDEDRDKLRALMRTSGIVEVAPGDGSNVIPPLACLYDIDLDDQEPNLRLCPDAEEALRGEQPCDLAALSCFTKGCANADQVTVCPSGFWGLRHEITVPLSRDKAADMLVPIYAGLGGPAAALVGTTPAGVLKDVITHARNVQGKFSNSKHVTSRSEWFKEAKLDSYGVLYFLCHGKVDRRNGSSVIVLGKPSQPGISRSNLKAYGVQLGQHPLVVLNACETGALEPERAINLVQGFTRYGASAVVGTEITIFTGLAYEFGMSFLDAFVAKRLSLGKSVQIARQDLFSKWNPLGLAYVAYGLSDLHLA